MTARHAASDEFLVWAQSLSGMLTRLRTRYGSVEEMLEHPDWDEGKNEYLLQLIRLLHMDLGKMAEEMGAHVQSKNRT
jgi:hypothetical protein